MTTGPTSHMLNDASNAKKGKITKNSASSGMPISNHSLTNIVDYAMMLPKKPTSAYNLWMADERLKASAEAGSPAGAAPQISFKEFGERWHSVPEEIKQRYQLAAAADKARFEKEMEPIKDTIEYKNYLKQLKEIKRAKADRKGKKRLKDPNAPKKVSGYLVFGNEVRPSIRTSNPNASFSEISKIISRSWATISDAEKKIYNDRAKEMAFGAGPELATSAVSARTASHPSNGASVSTATTTTTGKVIPVTSVVPDLDEESDDETDEDDTEEEEDDDEDI